MQIETEANNWFIKVGGNLKGPYPSREAASSAMVTEGLQGTIVPGTSDGKELLFG